MQSASFDIGNLVYVIIIILYIIYRAGQGKKRKEQKQRPASSSGNEPDQTARDFPKPKPLTDIFRDVEMRTKPYAQQSKPVSKKKEPPKKPATAVTPRKDYQKISPQSAATVSDKGTAYELSQDVIKSGEVSNYNYNFDLPKEKVPININLRNAMIANIILNRPEY